MAYWQSQGTARFNWPYIDVGPIGTNRHVSAPVLSAGHLLIVCRIICLAFLVNGGGRPASGYLVAGFVPHVPSGKFSACRRSSSATEVEEPSINQVRRGRGLGPLGKAATGGQREGMDGDGRLRAG